MNNVNTEFELRHYLLLMFFGATVMLACVVFALDLREGTEQYNSCVSVCTLNGTELKVNHETTCTCVDGSKFQLVYSRISP